MIHIFGYGVTTKPLVQFLHSLGIQVRIYDDTFSGTTRDTLGNELLESTLFKSANAPQDSKPLSLLSESNLAHYSLSIISPGIPPYHYLAKHAFNLIGEYDFFYYLIQHWSKKPKSVWISGTNGKTTTTQMTTYLLESFGAKSGGNIGTPLSELYVQKVPLWVLETSSFSLHYAQYATPDIYALLPVREDHISWHGNFESYLEDKLSVLARMQSDTYAIVPRELQEHPITKTFKGKVYFYADSKDLATQFGIDSESIAIQEPFLLDGIIALSIAKILYNQCDISKLNTFKIGAHRIEEFLDSAKRLWVDDSKGTNVDATIEAVRRYQDRHIFLILGGDDKGADLTPLFAFMQDKHIEIFAIGSNAQKLADLSQIYNIPCHICHTLILAVQAIKQARSNIESNNVALLSPAAASLDQFKSYKERGELFKQYALQGS